VCASRAGGREGGGHDGREGRHHVGVHLKGEAEVVA
jgi:hypothetical protein